MPTAYTAFIEDGEIKTGKEFLKLCTRNFGIAMDIRDEPLGVPTPTKFTVNPYYQEDYEKAKYKFENLKSKSLQEFKQMMIDEHNESIKKNIKYEKENFELNTKYEKVKKEVEEWIPPTKEHEGIKKFALEQIDMCMVSPNAIQESLEYADEPFDDSDEAVIKWQEEKLLEADKRVKRCKRSLDDEIKRVEEKNEFMKKFMESIEKI